MNRSSLLVRMVISIFLVFLILLALVGISIIDLVHQPLRQPLKAIVKRLSAKLATLSSLISKKLETTSTSLTQQTDVLAMLRILVKTRLRESKICF